MNTILHFTIARLKKALWNQNNPTTLTAVVGITLFAIMLFGGLIGISGMLDIVVLKGVPAEHVVFKTLGLLLLLLFGGGVFLLLLYVGLKVLAAILKLIAPIPILFWIIIVITIVIILSN